jgi:hypothetical protein
MNRGPRLDENEIRGAIPAGLGALEKQMAELGTRTTAGMQPGDRHVPWIIDTLGRRLVAWKGLSSDEPEWVARLEAIGEQVRALQTRPRRCSRAGGRWSGSRGPHRTEER